MSSEDQERRIASLLRDAAPPAVDPLFRLEVLELRERREFQRRWITMLAGALAIGALAALQTSGLLPVGAALASSYLAFRGRLPQILSRFM